MSGAVTGLVVYPVKGLSGQPLADVALEPGRGFPGDRARALAKPDGRYVPGTGQVLPKDQFFVLLEHERLAGLRTWVDPESGLARVSVRDHEVLSCDLRTKEGAAALEKLYARVLDLPDERAPRLAHEPPHRFTDVSVVSPRLMHAVSVINLASVRDLEARTGLSIDPRRFRANVHVDGLPPFSELDLVDGSPGGGTILLGGLRAEAVLNTRRCAAIEVDPKTARRDMPLPRLLMQLYGRAEFGVYVSLTTGGRLEVGDAAAW